MTQHARRTAGAGDRPVPDDALGARLAAARLFGEFGGVTWRPAKAEDDSP